MRRQESEAKSRRQASRASTRRGEREAPSAEDKPPWKPPPRQFPRTCEIPEQSPLYWVQQRDRYVRQLLIYDIEAITKRRLLVYFASQSEEDAAIDSRDVAYLCEIWGDVGNDPVDLLVETPGGYTDATEGLVSFIQSRSRDFRVIVANAAKSNGTLLCLAAKAIVMGAVSELGPIDPQIRGIPCTILQTPEIRKQNFVLHQTGVYALQQTRSLAEKLLSKGMMKGVSPKRIKRVVRALSTRERFFSHGSVIDHKEASALGLKVVYLPPEDEFWRRIWLLYCMYDFDLRRNRFLKIVEARVRSTAIAAPSPTAGDSGSP